MFTPSFIRKEYMQKIIIFDFMRTLYDPDAEKIVPGALELLQSLRDAGYILVLLSTEIGNKADPIAQAGIAPFFEKIILTRNKTTKDFAKIQTQTPHDPQESYVVGDRVRGEIKIGNICGYQTIWLKKGKFASQKPRTTLETPRFTITALPQLQQILA